MRAELLAELLARIDTHAPGLANTLWGSKAVALGFDTTRYRGGWPLGGGMAVSSAALGEVVVELWLDAAGQVDLEPLLSDMSANPLQVRPELVPGGSVWWWGAQLDTVTDKMTDAALVVSLRFALGGWRVADYVAAAPGADEQRRDAALAALASAVPAGVFVWAVPDEELALAVPTLPAVLVAVGDADGVEPENSSHFAGQITTQAVTVWVRATTLHGESGVERMTEDAITALAGLRLGTAPNRLRGLALDGVSLVDTTAGVFTREVRFIGQGNIPGRSD